MLTLLDHSMPTEARTRTRRGALNQLCQATLFCVLRCGRKVKEHRVSPTGISHPKELAPSGDRIMAMENKSQSAIDTQ